MSSTEKRLAFRWIASNALGWPLVIGGGLDFRWECILGGAVIGVAQWLALHRRLYFAPAWIAGTWFAWTVGLWAGAVHGLLIPDPYWAGISGGTLAGLAQSCVLGRQVSRPVLWVPATIVSSTLGWVAGTILGLWVYDLCAAESVAYLTGSAVGGAVIGGVSAPILLLMLRHPKAAGDRKEKIYA
jgi:hypothetical protein